MLKGLSRIFRTATARQSFITSVSSVVNGLLGAVFYFSLARFLGADEYGLLSLSVFLITTLAAVFDFGSDQSLIMFIPKNPFPGYLPYLKLALVVKIISSLTVGLVLFSVRDFISVGLFHQPLLSDFFLLVSLGLFTQLLFSFSTAVAQSFQKYIWWSLLFVGTNLFRLVFLFFLFNFRALTGYTALFVYILLPLLGFFVAFPLFKTGFLVSRITIQVIKNFFSFNKWITGFTVLTALSSRLDVFFSARYVSLSALGVYGLSTQLVSIFPQLTSALGAVISPKFSSFTNHGQNRTYVFKSTLLSASVALLAGFLLIPLSILVIGYTGQVYQSGFLPFLILLISSIIFLIMTPLRDSLLYYHGQPKIFFYTGIQQILLFLIVAPFIMSRYSIIGSALLVLANTFISSVIYLLYYKKYVSAGSSS